MTGACVLLLIALFTCGAACPDGWTSHMGKCYVLMHEPYNWFDAETECQLLKGTLAEPITAQENEYIRNILYNAGVASAWIGINDMLQEGTYVKTSSQEQVEFTFWRPNEPNDMSHTEDCVHMDGPTGQWNDNQCETYHLPFVCEREQHEGSVIG